MSFCDHMLSVCLSVSMSHFSSRPPSLNKGINYFVCSNEGPHMYPFPMGFKSNVNEYTLTTCKPIGHKASFCWRGFMIFYIWERSFFSQKGNMYSFILFCFNQCASIIIAFHKFVCWKCFSGEQCGPWASCSCQNIAGLFFSCFQ